MNTGMLWFDNDRKTALGEKVSQAAEYYRRKYGGAPNLCLVHPSMLDPKKGQVEAQAGRVTIRAHHLIQPDHLWIGMDEHKN